MKCSNCGGTGCFEVKASFAGEPEEEPCEVCRGTGEAGQIIVMVLGVPAPQGSKRHVGNGVLVESSKRVKEWRETVAQYVRAAAGGRVFGGAVKIQLMFGFERPKSHSTKDGGLNAAGHRFPYKTSKPDIDKLARAILDAITMSRVIVDDAQVVELHATKEWAGGKVRPGVEIIIEEVPAPWMQES